MKKEARGFTLYRSEEVVVIATLRTTNRKTGNMVQVWILDPTTDPVTSVKTGKDASTVCKGCKFASGNGCYVNVGQAPLAVWKGYHKGIYPFLGKKYFDVVFGGRKVRFGAYGNPSLIPLDIVSAIAKAAKGWTGYFHDWHLMPKEKSKAYGKFFMASTETDSSRCKASDMGLRYFHVSPNQPRDTIECLSDAKGISCAECQLCQGLAKSRLKSVWINPHGSRVAKANAVALSG
jgi:hypothetical protein